MVKVFVIKFQDGLHLDIRLGIDLTLMCERNFNVCHQSNPDSYGPL